MDISLSAFIAFTQAHTLALILYVGLGGTYLVAGPLLTLAYLNQRWYTAGSVERLLMYFGVFFFFPGLLLFSPFINYRPQPPS